MNRSPKHLVLFLRIAAVIAVAASAASLALPYLHRLNVHSGPLDIRRTEAGTHYFFAYVSLILLITSCSLLFGRNRTWAIAASGAALLTCIVLNLVRFEIHFQGFIDHDFDTKAGTGFYILGAASVLVLIVSIVAIALFPHSKKSMHTDELLDESPD